MEVPSHIFVKFSTDSAKIAGPILAYPMAETAMEFRRTTGLNMNSADGTVPNIKFVRMKGRVLQTSRMP
jgi:hypothetical protein